MTEALVGAALVVAPLATGIAVGLVVGGRNLVSTLLAAYLAAWASVIAIVTLLSPFRLVERGPLAAAELAAAALATLVWLRAGRPLPSWPASAAPLRSSRALPALGAVVAASLVYASWLVWELAPNTYDSLTYHLPRAVQWLQLAQVDWIADAPTARQNVFPPGAEIGALQAMLTTSSDRLVEVPQLVAAVVVIVAVAGLARRLGANPTHAALSGLLTAAFSMTALQATTTQNDLVVASFVVAAAYFLLSDLRYAPALAGLATALALGTKLTALFALPILVLLALTAVDRRRAVSGAVALIGFSLVLVAPFAVRNLVETGELVGGDGIDEHRAELSADAVASTIARVGYRMLDLSGYGRTAVLALAAVAIAIAVARALRPARFSRAWLDAALVLSVPLLVLVASELLGRALVRLEVAEPLGGWQANRLADEDISYFGPLGAALLLPACALVLARGRRRAPAAWVLALSLPLFVGGLALVYQFNPWWGRFLLVPVVLAAPLLPAVLARPGVAAGAIVVASVSLVLAHAENRYKPTAIGGGTPVWQLSRYEVVALTSPGDNDEAARAYETADRLLPKTVPVGALFGSNDHVFPLWDASLEREVVYLPAARAAATAAQRGLVWVVVGPSASPSGFARCAWQRQRLGAGWTLLARRPPSADCP